VLWHSIFGRQAGSFWRRHGSLVRVIGCFLSGLAATFLAGLSGTSNLIWIPNGLLLSYLLLAPRWRWKQYFAAGFAAQMVGAILSGAQTWPVDVAMTVLNLLEVAIAAFLLGRSARRIPQFTERVYVVRFVAMAVIAAPLLVAMVFAPIAHSWAGLDGWASLRDWFTTDALGMAVATPAFIAIFRTRFRETIKGWTNLVYPLLLASLLPFLFYQTRLPAMAIIFPLLILIQLRLGLGWASLATLFVAGAGSVITSHSGGFPHTRSPIRMDTSGLRLQFFLASAMFTLYSISWVVDNLRSTKRRLQEIVTLHNLVTDNSRDVIIIADFKGNRRFVSAAASSLGGWTREELLGVHSLELVHPEDRPLVIELMAQLKAGKDEAMLECRVRKSDGAYVWVEASLRTIRDPLSGVPTGVLNMVRDISVRKRAERELRTAYEAVEKLAIVDPLTGLANRRRFDECLTAEWRRGLRERQPLSLVLIDVDLFKLFNDTYGHVRGDSCLKQIAESAMDVVTRPGDLVARFGGEEFAIILPHTDQEGALTIADGVVAALRHRNLRHQASPFGLVTISAGCATMVPPLAMHASDLIELADRAMYQAKRDGRNRVCTNGQRMAGSDQEKQDPSVLAAQR
jgi:diguanylate cyclase (GGDEF)-like protein/PAS domain S-box-containing protein